MTRIIGQTVMRAIKGSWFCLLVTLMSCGDACPPTCPGPLFGIDLIVKGSAQAGPIEGVNATLSGPTTNTLSCASNEKGTGCLWSSGTLPDGDYLLEVTAPGFQPAEVAATVTTSSGATCGCTGTTLQPSTITLDPS